MERSGNAEQERTSLLVVEQEKDLNTYKEVQFTYFLK